MKRTILVALTVSVLLVVMAGAAYAEGWDTGSYGSTAKVGFTWSSLGESSAYLNGLGNPHGGFDNGTHNCTVCHSVHHAVPQGEALLPSSVAEACIYCHITPGDAGYIVLYRGNQTLYTQANDNGHNAANMPSGCTDCHQVHAAKAQMVSDPAYGTAGTAMSYLVTKLLKVDGSGLDMTQSNGDDLNLAVGTTNDVAVSYWCTTCHYTNRNFDGAGDKRMGYYNPTQSAPVVSPVPDYSTWGGWTHVMKEPGDHYTTSSGDHGRVAQSGSTACIGCHSTGITNETPSLPHVGIVASNDNFPHYADGVRFLKTTTALDANGQPTATGPATDSHADGVCIYCHRGANVTSGGVGMGW